MSTMETAAEARLESGLPVRSRGPWLRALARFRRRWVALAALAMLLVIFAAGAFAGKLSPYSYREYNADALSRSPTLRGHHFFGTDQIGRDLFSRTLFGIRSSVEVGLAVAVLASLLGLAIGAIAGYYGGWFDSILMRLVDFVVTIPVLGALFVAILFLGVPTPRTAAEVLILYLWTSVARVVRGNFAALRETEYVEAARASGASDARIVMRHLIPNSFGSILVAGSLLVGQAILLDATLDFFNFGISGNTQPSLGNLVGDAAKYGQLDPLWWLYTFPALVIVVMLVCVNLVADSLDDALNPLQARSSG